MGSLRAARTLCFVTYGDIVHRPLYYVILFGLAILIFSSQYLTMFTFYLEANMVREIGIATLTFFGFVITIIFSGIIVTQELEDRTAITLLSKPIARGSYLLGRFAGLMLAILPGILILAGILFLTLWLMNYQNIYGSDARMMEWADQGWGAFDVLWRFFVKPTGSLVLSGALLSFLQIGVLAAISISFAALVPIVVSVSATSLIFVLGNMSSYMLAAVERMNVKALSVLARAIYYLMPNLGYFNLQSYFSEGKLVAPLYLLLATGYAALYVSGVFLCSCAAFERREIR